MVWRSILGSCGLPSKKVQSIVLEVGRYLVDTGHDKIWKPHCEAQVGQEKDLGITQGAKIRRRVQAARPMCKVQIRPKTTYISHALAGECSVCQVSLAVHQMGECPPLLAQAPVLADSLLQMYHKALCSLPPVYNPRMSLKVLDSTGEGVREH